MERKLSQIGVRGNFRGTEKQKGEPVLLELWQQEEDKNKLQLTEELVLHPSSLRYEQIIIFSVNSNTSYSFQVLASDICCILLG